MTKDDAFRIIEIHRNWYEPDYSGFSPVERKLYVEMVKTLEMAYKVIRKSNGNREEIDKILDLEK